jgi:hypothetical protein
MPRQSFGVFAADLRPCSAEANGFWSKKQLIPRKMRVEYKHLIPRKMRSNMKHCEDSRSSGTRHSRSASRSCLPKLKLIHPGISQGEALTSTIVGAKRLLLFSTSSIRGE